MIPNVYSRQGSIPTAVSCALLVAVALAVLATPSSAFAMEESGSIGGTAVDAVSGDGVAGIEVCAYEAIEQAYGGCAVSEGGGEYTIKRLPGASYKVFFAPHGEHGYVEQLYNDESSWYSADKGAGEASPEVQEGLQEEAGRRQAALRQGPRESRSVA